MSETPRTQTFADQYAPYDLANSKVDWQALFAEWVEFAGGLENELNHAREISKKYEDRYFAASIRQLELNTEIARLNQLLSGQ